MDQRQKPAQEYAQYFGKLHGTRNTSRHDVADGTPLASRCSTETSNSCAVTAEMSVTAEMYSSTATAKSARTLRCTVTSNLPESLQHCAASAGLPEGIRALSPVGSSRQQQHDLISHRSEARASKSISNVLLGLNLCFSIW
jgi:hypothetical protein